MTSRPGKSLVVFVEGPDDERFVKFVVTPLVLNTYDQVIIKKYANEKKGTIKQYVKAFRKNNMFDYYFTRDMDAETCVEKRKKSLKFGQDESKVIIVCREIESWYLAGLDQSQCKTLRVTHHRNTESVSKEQFDKLIPPRTASRTAFLIQVLTRFSLKAAKSQNTSFRYFAGKLNI